MSQTRNYIIYDIETSGRDPKQNHEIVQIAAIPVYYHNLKEHSAGRFQIVLKPNNPDAADPEAIRVIGEDLWEKAKNEGIDQKIGLQKFIDWAATVNDKNAWYGKPLRVGHNIKNFDNPFLDYWLAHYKICKTNDNGELTDAPWFYWSNDTLDLYRELFELDFNVKNYKLDTCAQIIGYKRSGETHDAMEDVEITYELYKRYKQFIRKAHSMMKVNNG